MKGILHLACYVLVAFHALKGFAQELGQQAYLKASNAGADDAFGLSVALCGETMVVGAYGEASKATGVNGDPTDNSLPYAGAAYVFVRNGSNWTQQAYLKASNTGGGDFFGRSVAVSGDTIVVGGWQEDSGATGVNGNQNDNSVPDSGATYVFVRSGTNWTQQAYLKASNTRAFGEFGNSVAVSEDTIVVGGLDAAYVFAREGTNWIQQADLTSEANDRFGYSVAVSGDTVVIGEPYEDSDATDSGAAYVFVRTGTNWTRQAYLKASNAGAGDYFGLSVAISGETIVIGAPDEASNAIGVNGNESDNSMTHAGAAYVFVRTGTRWSQQAYLKASNTGSSDLFGYSVAVSGDAVVVGAYHEDSGATGINGNQTDNSASLAGAAYLFVRSGTNWTQRAYLKASNTEAFDRFARSVALSGDTVLVGAFLEDSDATGVGGNQNNNGAAESGAAYVFSRTAPLTPRLGIARSDSNVRVFWPILSGDFLLEETSSLSAPSWMQVRLPHETNSTHISVTVPATIPAQFYRLRYRQ